MEDNWKMLVQYNVLGGGLTMEVVSKIINVMNAPTNPTITPTIHNHTELPVSATLDNTFT